MPAYLLAALYATALPFSIEDDQLSLKFRCSHSAQEELWRIVYKCLQHELHRPRLCVLQAALLYIHKLSQHQTQATMQEAAFMWSFTGTVVGLAHDLGLHLECRMYAVPTREKKIRRRLWWATYIEDKFMSLLLGRPPYIHHDECDVSELDEADFSTAGNSTVEGHRAFQDMCRLALIANSLQFSL